MFGRRRAALALEHRVEFAALLAARNQVDHHRREQPALAERAADRRALAHAHGGVLHCGLYYKPGSLKARLAVGGIRSMTQFCKERGIPHEICGKVVVASDAAERSRLDALEERDQPLLRGDREARRREDPLQDLDQRSVAGLTPCSIR